MFRKLFLPEQNMMIAAIINGIIIALLYFPSLEENIFLQILDYFFIIFFLVEAFVKIRELGFAVYWRSSWNRFDLLVVLLSLPSLLVNYLPLPDTSIFLLLRLIRLVRLVRLIRFFSFIPHMGKILDGLGRAIRSSVFVLLALFFLNFLLAIFTCHFYGEVEKDLFGDPLKSFFSIFQMFTVEGWNEIPSTVAEKMEQPFLQWVMRGYFALIVLFGGIFGMSLANAVFVDEMTADNNKSLEQKMEHLTNEIKELKALIQLMSEYKG